jgi:hypothetical protein
VVQVGAGCGVVVQFQIESDDVSVISVVAVLIKRRSSVRAREDAGQRGASVSTD